VTGSRGAARLPVALLLDIGNSRLKWALLRGTYRRGQRFAATGTFDLSALDSGAPALRRWLRSIAPAPGIVACNVAGGRVERRLRQLAAGAGAGRPRFLRTSHAAAGVRNAYAEPWRLGADRWAALIGAHSQYPGRSLCLVTVGTAMTIDLLDQRGRHRGGSIIPGPELMVDALLTRTAGIRRRAGGQGAARAAARAGRRTGPFARDTRGAVTSGALHAAAALIIESMRAARALLGRRPSLIISGGAAAAIAPLLRLPYRRGDDLIWRGLAVLGSDRSHFD